MNVSGRRIAVTGGGRGLGADVCRLAKQRGAVSIAVIDIDVDAAREVAEEVSGIAIAADVTDEEQVAAAVSEAGELDLWVHNAGLGAESTPFSDDSLWQRMWDLHVMSVVYATRALLPSWLKRGDGHFSVVASANGLTTNPISAAYTASKHAEVALAEWLAMTYGPRGIGVSCFCPKGILTPMLLAADPTGNDYVKEALETAVASRDAAGMLLDMVESDRFLSTTYPPVLDDYRFRATDPDRYVEWLGSEHRRLVPDFGDPNA